MVRRDPPLRHQRSRRQRGVAEARSFRVGAGLVPAREGARAGGRVLLAGFLTLLLALAAAAEPRELAPERRARLEALVGEVERLRGLPAPEGFEVRVVDAAGLAAEIDALMARDLPDEVLRPAERALKLFGLLPPESDLRAQLAAILGGQVVGYFDPEREALVLVDGAEVPPGPAEDAVMVHELGHLVQHARFDLAALVPEDPLSDRATAIQALVEGDATLVMLQYLVGDGQEERAALGALLAAPEALGEALGADLGPGLDGAPAYLREGLLFPYLQGLLFCAALREAGGQELLDRAFAERPPASSEQILHPEKWLDGSDPPVEVELPDLAALLGGAPRTAGTLGEHDLRVLLAERLPGSDPETLRAAAEGWGGDAFALYGDPPDDLLVWVTEWDTAGDAAEFHALATRAFPDAPAAAGPATRVVLLLGAPPPEPEALLALLASDT